MHHACKTYLLLYVGGVSMTNLQIASCGSVCILNSTLWLQMEFYPVHANKVRVPGSEGPNAAIKGLRSLLEKIWKFLNVLNQILLDIVEVLNSYRCKKSLCFTKYKVMSWAALTWNTRMPVLATARLIFVPSLSLAGCKRIPYISSRRAISKSWKSDSAGVCPLEKENREDTQILHTF